MNGYRTHAPSSRNGTNAARSGTTKTNLSARFRSVSITPETNKQDNVYGWDKWSKDRAKGDRTLAKEKEKKKQRDENDSDEDTDASMGEPEFEVVNGVLKKKKKD
ncbi:hypothetical protein EJ04DRAFT_512956 [Polyplosphaeria fusca]|uniref:Uncharacterized protein n=1 Tax=Polyplosphaeria fusca TaxID=682080 RepID=A0A9P4QZ85_9PLEO|nr:hypothetical protein EJ04DRAFT_512956 [Polyplosphaeria fusca]